MRADTTELTTAVDVRTTIVVALSVEVELTLGGGFVSVGERFAFGGDVGVLTGGELSAAAAAVATAGGWTLNVKGLSAIPKVAVNWVGPVIDSTLNR